MSGAAAGWAYCVAVAALLAVAAGAGEPAMRGVGRPGRWAWLGAMALTLLLPLTAWLGLRVWDAPVAVLPAPVVVALPAVTAEAAAPGGAVSLAWLVPALWGTASLLLVGWLGSAVLRLRSARKGWRAERVAGVDVLVTEGVGPAVFGLRRASILLPSWALELDADLCALMLLHEREHVRAGDPWLLAAALGMVVLMPWNPALWFMLHRLRLAVEMDCDARVLARAPDRSRYGALLLEVGGRRAAPLPVLALSEPVTFLERRIRAFTRRAGPHAARRALLLGTIAFAAGSLAVCARDPISPQREAATDALAVTTEEPEFTPYTEPPRLRNIAQVSAALRQNYPPLLRDGGLGGTAQLWMYIDEKGVVQRISVAESSGYPALDDAALRVAELMEYEPAKNRDRVVAVWLKVPVTFASSANGARTNARERVPVTDLPPTPKEPGVPYFTPFTQRPQLTNAAEVSRMLQREFPPLLRDAGLGGTAVLWFHIDATGRVTDVRVNNGSGYEAIDAAAERVARMMTFQPAENRGEPVAVWVQIPITFSAK